MVRKSKISEREKFEKAHPIVAEKIEKSLRLSIKEGGFASAMRGFGVSYLTPFVLALNATSSQVGLMNAFIHLIPGIVQLKTAKLIERFSRKKIIVTYALIQAFLFFPLILAGVLFLYGFSQAAWIAIFFVVLFHIFGAIAHPVWFSWMGSLVPDSSRGVYFSRRNRVVGFVGLVTMVIGAFILDYSKSFGYWLIGFSVLFILAFIARVIALKLLQKMYEPRLKLRKKDYFSFWDFLKKAKETPFGRFTLLNFFFKVSVAVASPFFAVYMLRNLQFSYVWFMVITISATIFQLMFLPILGKFSDRFGNVLLFRVCASFLFLGPLLWVLSSYLNFSDFGLKMFLIFGPSLAGGFGWAGVNLATNNYIYDSVRQEKRSFCLGYFNLIIGVGMFLGAGLGSIIALFDVGFMETLIFIFLISSLMRLVVLAIGSKFLREVRHVKHFSKNFIIKEFQPMQGFSREVHHFNQLVEKAEHLV